MAVDHVLLVKKLVLYIIFGGREGAIVSCNDEDESVGYGKPELGVVEESGEREVEDVEDGNVKAYGEEKGQEGYALGFSRVIFFGFVGFH